MQVDDDASTEEVKSAYRSLAKVCHPDFTGDAGHNLCILLNEVRPQTLALCCCRGDTGHGVQLRQCAPEPVHGQRCGWREQARAPQAYEVLSSPQLRAAYNEQLEVALQDDSDGYTGAPRTHAPCVMLPARKTLISALTPSDAHQARR